MWSCWRIHFDVGVKRCFYFGKRDAEKLCECVCNSFLMQILEEKSAYTVCSHDKWEPLFEARPKLLCNRTKVDPSAPNNTPTSHSSCSLLHMLNIPVERPWKTCSHWKITIWESFRIFLMHDVITSSSSALKNYPSLCRFLLFSQLNVSHYLSTSYSRQKWPY